MKTWLLAIFAVTLAYGPEWIPSYIGLFSLGELQVLGHLSDYELPCNQPPKGPNSICRHQYYIPSEILNSNHNPALGIGMVVSAVEVFCIGNPLPIAVYDDPVNPGRSYATLNNYIVISGSSICASGLLIRSWSSPQSLRHGLIGGKLVAGSETFVGAVKLATEYLTKDIRMLIALVMIFAMIVRQSAARISTKSMAGQPFENTYWAWIGFLLVSSGTLQLVIPLHQPLFYTRLSAFFSLIAHITPIVKVAIQISRVKRISPFHNLFSIFLTAIFAATVAISTSLSGIFGHLIFGAAALGLVIAIVARHNVLATYCCILMLGSLKLMNIPFTPLSHVTALFVMFLSMGQSIARLQLSQKLLEALGIGRNLVARCGDHEAFVLALDSLRKLLKIGRLTFMESGDSSDCLVTFVDRSHGDYLDSSSFKRHELPRVAAHVLTTNRPIWHVSEGTPTYRQIMRRESIINHFSGKTFSAIRFGEIGKANVTLAFTNYSSEARNLETLRETWEEILHVVSPYIVESANKRQTLRHLSDSGAITRLHAAFGTIFNSTELAEKDRRQSSLQQTLQRALEVVLEVIGTSGFIASVDPGTFVLTIHALSGYNESVASQLRSGTVVADPGNQHGPVPLAYHGGDLVIVADHHQLDHVMHPVSVDLLQRNDTGSMAAIPLVTNSVEGSSSGNPGITKWGILWIEQKRGNTFGAQEEALLRNIRDEMNALLRTIVQIENTYRAKAAIESLVPAHVAAKMLEGQNPSESDHGYIFMLDLKGSSKIAKSVGAPTWASFAGKSLRPKLEEAGKLWKMQLHQVIWDAYYFTLSAEVPASSHVTSMLAAAEAMTRICNREYKIHGFEVIANLDSHANACRICAVFGDISRSLTEAPSPTWSITGTTMAIGSKLESAVKGSEGDFFMLERDLPANRTAHWFATDRWLDTTGDVAFAIKIDGHFNDGDTVFDEKVRNTLESDEVA